MKRGKATLPLAERSRRVFLGGLRRRFAGVLMLSAVRHVSLASLLLAAVLSLLVPGFVDAQPTTTRVSVGPGGAKANGDSCYTGVWADNACTAISADGRWVAFRSLASNLVAGDTNGHADVFVHDRGTGETRRVSVGSGSAEGDGDSEEPTISADGRWVAFSSWASNLVVGDTNLRRDVFVHDQQTGTTTRVSVGTGGAQGNGDGQFPSISADGRWVAFESRASNLVPGDTNLSWDVLVHDRETGTTTRVSVGSGGAEGNGDSSYASISGDGRWVAFRSYASNLVPRDTNRGINPISGADVFLHDRESGTTTRVSVASDGTQANGSSTDSAVSADGRRVAFFSVANNLVANDTNSRTDVFVHDRQTGTTRRVSVGPGGAQG
ncbi:MAG: hypothetical protein OEW19_03460, partial [Acidobacteriota bacterium]|nr:hypothetical protein [Acidobacteriota bacterium]